MTRRPRFRWLIPTLALLIVVPATGGQRQGPRGPRGEGRRPADRVEEGDQAPDFQLRMLEGKKTVRLSSYRKKKPVALIFGSYT